MSLLGLELSDAGIMAAATDPVRLLQIDGADRESPGFALPEKNRLLVGKAAESKARLHPRRFQNFFWDRLTQEPLKQPSPYARNHAEMAFAHLAKIWDQIKRHGNEMIVAVPGYWDRNQLGLLLGIAEALSIPLKGIVAQPVAASSWPSQERSLLHLDIHLHRVEIAFLEQGDRLDLKDTVTIEGKGLHDLYRAWVEAIAGEFVHTTRYDPLHEAVSEQELYNRLPEVLVVLRHNPFVMFEMTAGHESYRISLSRDLFTKKSENLFKEIDRQIGSIRKRYGREDQPLTLQLTQRIGRLPGCREMTDNMTDVRVIALEPGSGAIGVLNLKDEISKQKAQRGVPFLTSRQWQGTLPEAGISSSRPPVTHDLEPPTHLLYRNKAYPISDRPLIIGRGRRQDGVNVTMVGAPSDVSSRHCSIQRRSKEVVLTDYSTHGTFVDDIKVSGTIVLKLGQIIRVGTPGEKFQLIACLGTDET
jgi:hypothetical protein